MLRSDTQAEVGFTARVPPHHKTGLEAVLTATSGKTWFIRTALEQFNDTCESRPDLVHKVREEILGMRAEEPPRGLVDFLVRVPRREYDRFNTLFPDKGSITWFIRNLLEIYTTQAEGRPTPDQHVLESVQTLLGITHKEA